MWDDLDARITGPVGFADSLMRRHQLGITKSTETNKMKSVIKDENPAAQAKSLAHFGEARWYSFVGPGTARGAAGQRAHQQVDFPSQLPKLGQIAVHSRDHARPFARLLVKRMALSLQLV